MLRDPPLTVAADMTRTCRHGDALIDKVRREYRNNEIMKKPFWLFFVLATMWRRPNEVFFWIFDGDAMLLLWALYIFSVLMNMLCSELSAVQGPYCRAYAIVFARETYHTQFSQNAKTWRRSGASILPGKFIAFMIHTSTYPISFGKKMERSIPLILTEYSTGCCTNH